MNTQSGFPIVGEVEVSAKAERRRFTAEYKRKILKEADGCSRPGELGALLRREGLYSSHLAAWRRVREQGGLAALSPRRRGPKAKVADPRDKRIVELERENRRLQARLERAEGLIEVQKKVAALLGKELPPTNEES
jgi:transposase